MPGRSVPTSRWPTSSWCSWRCGRSPTCATRSPPSLHCVFSSSLLDGLRPGHEPGDSRPAYRLPARPGSAPALRARRHVRTPRSAERVEGGEHVAEFVAESLRAPPTGTAGPYRRPGASAPVPRRGLRRAPTRRGDRRRRPAPLGPAAPCARQTGARRRRPAGASAAATIFVRLRARTRRCSRVAQAPGVEGQGDARFGGRARGELVVERRRPDAHHQPVPPADPPQAEPVALFENHDHPGQLASLIVTIKAIMIVTAKTSQACLVVTRY